LVSLHQVIIEIHIIKYKAIGLTSQRRDISVFPLSSTAFSNALARAMATNL